MAARSRIRRIAKWGCTLAAAALGVIWVGSSFANVANQDRNLILSLGPRRQYAYFVSRGIITCIVIPESDSAIRSTSNWIVNSPRWPKLDLGFRAPGLYSIPRPKQLNLPANTVVLIPIWLPFVLVAVPTAFLWYRDGGRIPLGHCSKCGYDLMLNMSGTCPECGTEIEGSSRHSAPPATDTRDAEQA